ncbi:MAG TPA: ABC transporter permease [Roseiarcus sp.]|nr:ABC transporter permease [Roseiarcus sp.]
MKSFLSLPTAGPAIATLAVALIVSLTTHRFLTPGNLNNLALQVSIVALIAIGSTAVIIVGGIDLSPGSAIALLTMLLAMMLKFWGIGFWPAIGLTVLGGAAIGLVNGAITAYLRIPAFITTLAGYSAFRGLAFMFNNGSPVFEASNRLEPLFYGQVLGIPLPLVYIVVFFAAAHWLMRHTRLGRSIYAVGGNANAARLSGINVRNVQLSAFVLAGLMAGIAAVLMAARLNSGSPNYGVGLELSAIAAAVIGGASLSGGRGDMIATLFGALTVTIVQNGLNLNAVQTSTQNIVLGAIIVIAVGLDMWRAEIGAALSSWTGKLLAVKGERRERRKAQ